MKKLKTNKNYQIMRADAKIYAGIVLMTGSKNKCKSKIVYNNKKSNNPVTRKKNL